MSADSNIDVNAGDTIYPSNAEFFAGKTVGITGGTGFLGQAIIEKILRCCPDVKKIILLIRHKRNQTPEARLKGLENLPVFRILRQTQPDFPAKLSFLAFDLEADDLGLSVESIDILQGQVEIFYHCAATVKFTEHLRKSFVVNVQAVRRLLKIATGMIRLQAFVHISTAYSHSNRREIDEKFYEVGIDYLDLEASLRLMDDDLVTKVTPQLLGKRPNTYTLTKALAEDVLAREGSHLPICIVRPSIIISACKEPLPGWTTNLYGPTSLIIAYNKGILRYLPADLNIVVDLVPVDFVVNASISAAMKTACDNNNENVTGAITTNKALGWQNRYGECFYSYRQALQNRDAEIKIPIYAVTTGPKNPLRLYRFLDLILPLCKEWPLDPIRWQFLTCSTNRSICNLSTFIRQTIPAVFYDAYLVLNNKKPMMRRMNYTLLAGMEALHFFITNEFVFGCSNADKLQKCLTPDDQESYCIDVSNLDWAELCKRYVIGTREFILKERMNGYPQARRKLRMLKLLNHCMDIFGMMFFLRYTGLAALLWKLIASIRSTTIQYLPPKFLRLFILKIEVFLSKFW